MNRFNLSFVACACLTIVVSQGCSSSSSTSSTPPAPTAQLALRFDAQPQTGLPGEPLAIAVSFRDANDQVATAAGGSVTLALAGNSPLALAGTTTRPVVNGVATFDDVVVPAAGQGYTLRATATNASSATSAAFDLMFSTVEAEQPGSGANDQLAGAEPIVSRVPVFASLSSADDVDVYKFHAKAGQLLSVSSYATRLDLAGWDNSLVVRLLGSDGAELQRMGSAETGLLSVDHGLAQVSVSADGDYYLSCEADPAAIITGKYALVMKLEDSPPGLQVESEAPGQMGLNDDLVHAQPLSPGLLQAFYQAPGSTTNDSDYYRIAITAPTRVRIQLLASRNGVANKAPALSVAWDSELELQDSSGTVLWLNDDDSLFDPIIDYVVTTPGDYFVRVKRFGADPGSTPYSLSYEALPYSATPAAPDTAVSYGQYASATFGTAQETQTFSFTGSKGDMVRVWILDKTHLQGSPATVDPSLPGTLFLDANQNPLPTGISPFASLPPGDSNLNVMQTILQSDGTHFVRFTNGTATGSFSFLLEKVVAAGYEAEPNDATSAANASGANGWISGVIATPGDKDTYVVHAEAGQLVSASLFAGSGNVNAGPFSAWGSALVPTLQVVDAQGNVSSATSASRPGAGNFAESVIRPDSTLEISFRAPTAGDYYVVVTDANGGGGPSFFYALALLKNK